MDGTVGIFREAAHIMVAPFRQVLRWKTTTDAHVLSSHPHSSHESENVIGISGIGCSACVVEFSHKCSQSILLFHVQANKSVY